MAVPTIVVEEVVPPPPAAPSVRGVNLCAILRDGETVYSRELINDGPTAGAHLMMSATFSHAAGAFVMSNGEHIRSPTTLCSRFRAALHARGMSRKASSTTDGYDKCYVMRDGMPHRLRSLL